MKLEEEEEEEESGEKEINFLPLSFILCFD